MERRRRPRANRAAHRGLQSATHTTAAAFRAESERKMTEPKVKEFWSGERGPVGVEALRPEGRPWAVDYRRDGEKYRLGLRRFMRDFRNITDLVEAPSSGGEK